MGPLLGLALAGALLGVAPSASQTPGGEERPALPPALKLADGWYATIETSLGTITIRLLPEQAPQSVAHFSALAEGRLAWTDPLTGQTKQGHYYDGLQVHLVAAAQRFEAGDPTATGSGAPPFYVPAEGLGPVNFSRSGRVGMTRSSLGRISGVQFFITASGLPWLNGHHPCFGEVVAGFDVVWNICNAKARPDGRPLETIAIRRVRIHSVGTPVPLPEPVRHVPTPPTLERRIPATG